MEKRGTIGIIRPPAAAAIGGNRTTAERWGGILEELGWTVFHERRWKGEPCDVLVALHARESHDSALRFKRAHRDRPLVVAGTGTDLYTDVPDGGNVREALGLADRIVVLQRLAVDALPEELRERARVIHQSVPAPSKTATPADDAFEIAFMAGIRPVKDPMTAVRAAKLLPPDSRIRILHMGGVIDEGLAAELEDDARDCKAWVALGERPRAEALEILGRSRLMISTSRQEGGANVVSEALAYDVPIVCTKIPGALGLLGEDYPGTFAVGDAEGLAEMLVRAERDELFYHRLRSACREHAWIVERSTEVDAWRRLLAEIAPE